MILKVKIKYSKRKGSRKMVIWVSKSNEIISDVKQLLEFFGEKIKALETRRIKPYYKLTSNNPALLLSFLSALQDMFPEIYFDTSLEESVNLKTE